MPNTPADRARAKQRIIKQGDYRGIIMGDIMQVHHKDDPAVPLQRLTDASTKTKPGNIAEWPESALRHFITAVGKEHSEGTLPPFENTGRDKPEGEKTEEEKDDEFGEGYNLDLE